MLDPIAPTRFSTRRLAFTLIEMIVVLVILGIMSTLIVPRLVGNEKREFKLAVEKTADLLMMYSQRENLGQKVVGIGHERSNNWLELWIIDNDNRNPDAPADWRPDHYVEPVKLPRFMRDTDVEIYADGEMLDASEWPICGEPGQTRPMIEIVLRGAGEFARLTLYPQSAAPTLNSSYLNSGVVRERYDLDGTGHSRENW